MYCWRWPALIGCNFAPAA